MIRNTPGDSVPQRCFPWLDDPEWQRRAAAPMPPESRVFVYQSSHDPYLTCSYYVETARGVVLFDTQLFRSSAEELWEEIKANTSSPLALAVITHGHPDHFWGTGFFRSVAPGLTVVTTDAILEDMRATTPPRVRLCHGYWGGEVPATPEAVHYPDATFTGSMTLDMGDLTVKLQEHGAAECPAHLTAWIEDLAFLVAGDILQNRQHLYVSDGAMLNWYRILQNLETLHPARILTGHQGVGGPDLLVETKHWMATLMGLLADEASAADSPEDFAALSDDARLRIRDEMRSRFPRWYDPTMFDGTQSVLEYSLAGLQSEVHGDEI